MCGIAGFIGYDPRLDEALLDRMKAAQSHRGPDDAGVYFRCQARVRSDQPPLRVGLAHNRLSIQDLSPAGHQPMPDATGRHWICYNGEFYNAPEHRPALQARGEGFRSTSDTEVLLYLCRDRGALRALSEVNGMFAFAYHNELEGSMALCRDRTGQKPLFYLMLPDGSLVFASELPALLASGLVDTQDLSPAALHQFWTMGFMCGEETPYPSVRRLLPAHAGFWKEGRFTTETYWQVNFDPAEDTGKPLSAYADELLSLVESSVRYRLLSVVPVGVCLSGGLDSALMALAISRLRADVPAFTIAFDHASADEAAHAAAVAKHLCIEHRILTVSESLAAEFPRIAGWYGEPFGDASSIPMFFLSRMIREHATVALTGDGGDELFGGYHHYRQGLAIWNPGYLEQDKDWLGPRGWARKQFLRLISLPDGYARLQRQTNPKILRSVLPESALQALNERDTMNCRARWLRHTRDPLAAMQNCDFHVYMTDDVHVKVDRMSMAHALECRSPFMDYRIIEWAAKLPARVKVGRDGRGKLVIRDILARNLPAALFDRPKQGFTPPWETWCVGDFRQTLRRAWRDMDDPWTRRDGIDVLVPEEGPVSPVLSWLAYAYVQWRQRGVNEQGRRI